MKTDNTANRHHNLKIGDIFTPHKWAEFAICEFGLFDKWLEGASVFDPCMGTGHLLLSLINHGINKGYKPEELPIKTLFGNELNRAYHQQALREFNTRYAVDMSMNFWNSDIIDLPSQQFDIIFGNPPWQNFVDLPTDYKEKIKPLFAQYNLINNSRDLLLGSSRIDISALIIRISIVNFLKTNGEACLFMPLSVLLNDGANKWFRTYNVKGTDYAIQKIFDFNKEKIFNKVSTRYGLVNFQRDQKPAFPVVYKMLTSDGWDILQAAPLQTMTSPLSVYHSSSQKPLENFELINLPKASSPRQGINTCGANNVFFFQKHRPVNDYLCCVNDNIELPAGFVFPLLTSANFKQNQPTPNRWVLLPYNKKGYPISQKELDAHRPLKQYLTQHQEKLKNRNGILLSSWLKKGYWWALLGVGPYNYARYKIVWEAYGRKQFVPILVEGYWQANQALQAFIPFQNRKEAEKVLKKLKNPAIEEYLLSLKMEGTMNWAQPGKIKNLIWFTND